LWDKTIETHRHQVHDAILETTAALVAEHGLRSVTMSQIAEGTGIGRATLYKYFPDIEAILAAWHEQHLTQHLAHLAELRDRSGQPGERLEAVAQAYARISHYRQRHGTPELTGLLHRSQQVANAHQKLYDLFRGLLVEVAAAGNLRTDVPPEELASYCVHALSAAGSLPSEAAVRRLVAVTLDSLHHLA
jgi:AcrR family transcriptional regulator